jgi:hypothetical protein
MSRTVIQVEGPGKCYSIGQGAQHTALRAPVRLLPILDARLAWRISELSRRLSLVAHGNR